ncbi:sensor domain-containing protein [Kitasatospora sp. NPDC088346]|uniref:sensor domain-containing protein n=1 Tax=Kitasatospora sp. NPDC088346 TaxID=3364073 RepID=UPI0037F6DBAF
MSTDDFEGPEMTATTSPYRPAAAPSPAFWRAPFSASTYREVGFVLTGLPTALLGFVLVVALLPLGLGLVVTALGLPVLALMLTAARGLGALDRERVRTLLGTPVTAPAPVRPARSGFWGGITARLADPDGWRAALYHVLMLPWAITSFVTTVVFLVTGWVLALYPAYHWVFHRYLDWPGYRVVEFTNGKGEYYAYYVTSPLQIAGVSLVGIALVLLTPKIVRGLTGVHRLAVRGLLGAR